MVPINLVPRNSLSRRLIIARSSPPWYLFTLAIMTFVWWVHTKVLVNLPWFVIVSSAYFFLLCVTPIICMYFIYPAKLFFFSEVARNLGYTIDYIPLYRDMSSRDLLQRRSTTPKGDTVWDVCITNLKSKTQSYQKKKNS